MCGSVSFISGLLAGLSIKSRSDYLSNTSCHQGTCHKISGATTQPQWAGCRGPGAWHANRAVQSICAPLAEDGRNRMLILWIAPMPNCWPRPAPKSNGTMHLGLRLWQRILTMAPSLGGLRRCTSTSRSRMHPGRNVSSISGRSGPRHRPWPRLS